jgi:hypothetical protein
MPLIATPISHLFENEEDALKISQVSDCLEVRQRSLNSELEKQWLFHIDIDLTQHWDTEIKDYLIYAISRKSELRLVTFQATRCCVGEELVDGLFQLSGDLLSREELLDNAIQNVTWLRKTFWESFDIGFENNNYYPTPAYEIVTDANFISEIVESCNIYFLLDIAHAMVTAKNRNIEYNHYVSQLPMKKVIQLHICQPSIPDVGLAKDAHNLPNELMLNEVVRLIEAYRTIEYLTVEYYKDSKSLIEIIKNIKNKIL